MIVPELFDFEYDLILSELCIKKDNLKAIC